MEENKEYTVSVYELIGHSAAVSADNGDVLFNRIDSAFKEKLKVIVDFQNIDLIVSTFLNAGIGQLYGSYTSDFIRDNLKVVNMSNDDLNILKKVVERAKIYFSEKSRFEHIAKKNIE